MSFSAILGAWIAAFLTLGIFSYLYRDNPFYKIAEHVFVGVSAADLVRSRGLGDVYKRQSLYWSRV